jgi:hypothetical protein
VISHPIGEGSTRVEPILGRTRIAWTCNMAH